MSTQNPSNVQTALGADYETVKALATANKVAIPEVIARMVRHVLTSDGFKDTIADLLSDAPRSQRGRRALSAKEKTLRRATKAFEDVSPEDTKAMLQALQARLDGGIVRA